jgi:G3E family GTPase
VRLVAISGIQGSGKTTLIREIIARVAAQGRKCGVIVNEDGEIRYDEDFVRSHHLTVESLRGG